LLPLSPTIHDLSTRQVEIAGIASPAHGLWMGQIGRKITDAVDGILNGKRYLIHDRDPLFTAEFLIPSCDQTSRNANVAAEGSRCAHSNRFLQERKSN
jgi:hypothetical protein